MNRIIQRLKQGARTDADAQPFQDDQFVIRFDIIFKPEAEFPALALRRIDNLKLFKLLAAALGHFGGGSAHKVAVDIILQFGGLLNGGVMQFLLALVGGFALGQVGGIVALVGQDGLSGQFPDAGADGVKEIAVMADNQHRAAVGFEIGFQPFHRFKVKMVGRFVQDQDVGAFQQQPRQAQPGLLPARKHAGLFLPGIRRKAHAAEHFFNLGIHIVGVHCIDHRHIMGDRRFDAGALGFGSGGQPLLQGFLLGQRRQRRGKRQAHSLIHILVGLQAAGLFQVTDRQIAGKGGDAGIGLAFAAKDAQQGCFAGAVGPDDADAVPPLDPGADTAEDLVLAKAFAEVLQFYQHTSNLSFWNRVSRQKAWENRAPLLSGRPVSFPKDAAALLGTGMGVTDRFDGGGCARRDFPALRVPSQYGTAPHKSRLYRWAGCRYRSLCRQN